VQHGPLRRGVEDLHEDQPRADADGNGVPEAGGVLDGVGRQLAGQQLDIIGDMLKPPLAYQVTDMVPYRCHRPGRPGHKQQHRHLCVGCGGPQVVTWPLQH